MKNLTYENDPTLACKILKAINVRSSLRNIRIVEEIIYDESIELALTAANSICENLDIPKRKNRSVIKEILEKDII